MSEPSPKKRARLEECLFAEEEDAPVEKEEAQEAPRTLVVGEGIWQRHS